MHAICAFDLAPRSGVAARVWRPLGSALSAALATLVTWQERAEQRQALAAMSERIQKDLGITHADIAVEINKPFWRA